MTRPTKTALLVAADRLHKVIHEQGDEEELWSIAKTVCAAWLVCSNPGGQWQKNNIGGAHSLRINIEDIQAIDPTHKEVAP